MHLSVVDQSPIPAGFSPADALHNTIDLAQRVEAMGYARYWIAEHHSTGGFASTAPEILIARVAAETSTIRVGSGAVLLPHYAAMKVAEQFSMLESLYPGRIDLGIGRAPGGTRLDSYALSQRREGEFERDDFGSQLLELLSFLNAGRRFPENHAFQNILVQPHPDSPPEVWLLGSSGWSAEAAAVLGLPYAAAHFINPETTRQSVEMYFAKFRPSLVLQEPRALVAVGAIVAESEQEAEWLYSSQRLRRLLRDTGQGDRGPLPAPEEATARLEELNAIPRAETSEWPRAFVGAVSRVAEEMESMTQALGLDEVMVVTVVHDHEARVRSHELLAQALL